MLRKTNISAITAFSVLLMAIFILGVTNVSAVGTVEIPDESALQIENSYTLCHDNIDNDDNGTKDMGDRNCSGFVSESVSPIDTTDTVLENSYTLCHDNIDNDDNGTKDMGDRNCSGFVSEPTLPIDTTDTVLENSYTLCHDNIDNDDNGTKDMGDRNCSGFVSEPTSTTHVEDSYALCHDGIDNDDNGTTDMGDLNCAGYVLENSFVLCHDGIDNDDNGTTDMGDLNCANYGDEPISTTTPPSVITTTSHSSSGGSRRVSAISPVGQVLGAQTEVPSSSTCNPFVSFMKRGKKNDVAEVRKLQKFLNETVDATLPNTGVFGLHTEKALNDFQMKNKETVLRPWVNAGFMSGIFSTGYFYKTSMHVANKIMCPNLNAEMPMLK